MGSNLLDAMVILPAYLDRLQAGHQDLPVLLLPGLGAGEFNGVSESIVSVTSMTSPMFCP